MAVSTGRATVDVVRLDAEGAEWDVLKQWVQSGVLVSSVGQLLVELHNWSEHRSRETCGLVRSIMANFMLFWAARNGEKRGDMQCLVVACNAVLTCVRVYGGVLTISYWRQGYHMYADISLALFLWPLSLSL